MCTHTHICSICCTHIQCILVYKPVDTNKDLFIFTYIYIHREREIFLSLSVSLSLPLSTYTYKYVCNQAYINDTALQ